jgi:hypothetical protein
MNIEHAATDSRAKEIIAYTYLHALGTDHILHSDEMEFLKKIALKDGVIDDDEARVIHELLVRVDESHVSHKVKSQIDAFRVLYPEKNYLS